MRLFLQYGLSVILVVTGVFHLAAPAPLVQIVPPSIPHPLAVVYLTGVLELASAAALQIPRLRRVTGLGLILFFLAIFPANIYMATHNVDILGKPRPFFAWARLPFQAVFIAWAWWFTKPLAATGRDLS